MPALVSVVVPVWNGERFLADCIRSLLAQEYSPIEIIVVDDGSTDGSAGLARSFPGVRVLERSHQGVGATRNAGIEAALGPLIGFCDSDDKWKPEKARVLVEFLASNPEVDLVLSRQDTAFEAGTSAPAWLIPDQVYGDLDGVSPTSALFRRTVFERLRYRTDIQMGTEFNLLVQARAAGFRTALLDRSLAVRRIHGNNMTSREGPAKAAMFTTVREHLRRNR